jgi:AraC-like DNA-binding protein
VEYYEEGDVVLLGQNLPHQWMNEPEVGQHPRVRGIVVQFREDTFGAEFWKLPELRKVQELLTRAGRGLVFSGAVRDAVAERIVRMQTASSFSRMMLLLETLDVLAGAKARVLSSPDFKASQDESSVERVQFIRNYVSSNYARDFSYAEIANSLGMTVSGLSHYFRRATGDTLRNFVTEVRVGQACRRLLLTDHSVSRIAMDCGFGSLSCFNDRFKKLRAMSPREFRKIRGCGKS